jgi:hypothetical protein
VYAEFMGYENKTVISAFTSISIYFIWIIFLLSGVDCVWVRAMSRFLLQKSLGTVNIIYLVFSTRPRVDQLYVPIPFLRLVRYRLDGF